MFYLFIGLIVVTFVGSIVWGVTSGAKAERQREAEARREAEANAAREAMRQELARKRKIEAEERREQRELERRERWEIAVQREQKKIQRQMEAAARQEAKEQAAREKAEAAKRRQQEAAEKREAERRARIAAARELAELRERELEAARELSRIRKEQPTERRETILNNADETTGKAAQAAAPDAAKPFQKPAPVTLEAFAAEHAEASDAQPEAAPGPFAGQVVSFTGKLSMPRRVAIEKVQSAGGRAYADMPAGTTLLVVGKNPGMQKMDKADRWIGQVRKITEAQFMAMFPA